MPQDQERHLPEEEKDIAQAVRQLFAEEIKLRTENGDLQTFNARNLYTEKQANRYEEELIALCLKNPKGYEGYQKYLDRAKEFIKEREKALRQHRNVLKGNEALEAAEKTPGNIFDIERLLRRGPRLGIDSHKVEEENAPVEIIAPPRPEERNRIVDKKVYFADNVTINEAGFEKFLDNADELTDKERRSLRSRSESLNEFSNFCEQQGERFARFFNAATAGVIGTSRVGDDSRFRNYQDRKGHFLKDWAQQNPGAIKDALYGHYRSLIDAKSQELAKLRAKENLTADDWQKIQNLETEILQGESSLQALSQMLEAQIKNFEAADKELNQKLQDALNSANDNLIYSEIEHKEGLKKLLKEEDDFVKWRIIVALLVLGPFAPAAVIPLNILGPIMQWIAPVFESGDLASGLASLVEIEGLGPITWAQKQMGLSTGVEWFLNNCPVLNEVVDLLSAAVYHDATRNLMGAAGNPFLESPIFGLMVGGLALATHGGREALHHIDVQEAMKHHDKAFENIEKKFKQERDENYKQRAKDIAQKSWEQLKDNHVDAKLIGGLYAMQDKPEYADYLKSLKVSSAKNTDLNGKSIKDVLDELPTHKDNGAELTVVEKKVAFMKAIRQADNYQELMDNFLLFQTIDQEGKPVSETIEELEKLAKDTQIAQEIIAKKRQEIITDFIIRQARETPGIVVAVDPDPADFRNPDMYEHICRENYEANKKRCGEFEKTILEARALEVEGMMRIHNETQKFDDTIHKGDGRKDALITKTPSPSPIEPYVVGNALNIENQRGGAAPAA